MVLHLHLGGILKNISVIRKVEIGWWRNTWGYKMTILKKSYFKTQNDLKYEMFHDTCALLSRIKYKAEIKNLIKSM